MKNRIIRIIATALIVMAIALGTAIPAFAATTQDVTITWTPTYIALTNDTATWSIGTVLESTTYWWTHDGAAPNYPVVDGEGKAIITNTGSVNEDIDIHTHNSTGGAGMTVSTDATPAASEFSLRAGITGMANEAAFVQVITTDAELKDALTSTSHVHWVMEMGFGTFAFGDAQQTTATLTASLAD
jgi:hypothetical protein